MFLMFEKKCLFNWIFFFDRFLPNSRQLELVEIGSKSTKPTTNLMDASFTRDVLLKPSVSGKALLDLNWIWSSSTLSLSTLFHFNFCAIYENLKRRQWIVTFSVNLFGFSRPQVLMLTKLSRSSLLSSSCSKSFVHPVQFFVQSSNGFLFFLIFKRN